MTNKKERRIKRTETELDLLGALIAIRARIQGEWDNPYLMAFGPLSADVRTDCNEIATKAIAQAAGANTATR